MKVPFACLAADREPAVRAAFERVAASGCFILGPEVEALERAFAAAVGVRHAVGVASGTDAITLTLAALGIGVGDRVLTSAFSTGYTALGIQRAGAVPVFGEVERGSLCLAAEAAETAMDRHRPAAVLPVHLYGHAGAGWERLLRAAARRGIPLIEDACQAHGARFRGRPLGSFGAAAAFSFYPTKNLAALGDGGLVATDDGRLAARVRRLREGGQRKGPGGRHHHHLSGWNSRLDEVQAAVLSSRLSGLEAGNRTRRRLAGRYREALAGLPLEIVSPGPDIESAAHLFVVRTRRRTALRGHLAGAGVATLVHFPAILPAQPAFRSGRHPERAFPKAAAAAAEVLSLPLHPGLGDHEIAFVAAAVRSFFRLPTVAE